MIVNPIHQPFGRRIRRYVQWALAASVLGVAFCTTGEGAEVRVMTERNREADSRPFHFERVPQPAVNDAAAQAEIEIVTGRADRNGGAVSVIHDGRVPLEEDQPAANFFFQAGTDGGRLVIDLGRVREIREVNTYSWHPGTRGPQVYRLFGSEGTETEFAARPKREIDLESAGWNRIATVDTRPETGSGGGNYGVHIDAATSNLGSFRYLLFDIAPTESADPFGNTFFSEIDVIAAGDPEVEYVSIPEVQSIIQTYESRNGKYRFRIDTSAAPDLTEWADQQLAPVVKEWYGKIVAMLPSEGFEAPSEFTIRFRTNMGSTPAATGRNRISCNARWFRRNLEGEARGAVVHEMVHVVQNYRRVRRSDPDAVRVPGWLVEGIPDYIRWFLYEPESQGAEITRRNLARARYDASYRVSANFLDWVVRTYEPDLLRRLNAAARCGQYNPELWKDWTGKSLADLGNEWLQRHRQRLNAGGPSDSSGSE